MIRYFAHHPTSANLLMLAFLMVGFMSFPTLNRETMPRIDPSRVQVSVAYPGARPEDIEESVCQRIEDAVDAVSHVLEIKCESRENRATATIEMVEGTNLDQFLADIKSEVEAITDFPDNTEKPVIKKLGETDLVTFVAITGPEEPSQLKALANDIKHRMLQTGDIPQVKIKGFSDHQIRIELKQNVLQSLGLSISDISSAISSQSVDLPAGSLFTNDQEILVRFADQRKRVHEFLSLIVLTGQEGGQIHLSDIATITDTFELDEEKIQFNGKRAALLEISKTPNEDTLKTIDAVRAFVKKEMARSPPSVKLVVTKDISSIVRDRLSLLSRNGLQGLFLVFLSIWFFFGFRYSFWVAIGLPVSFMGAFAVMSILGMSINMITMVGLLIVIGILMDDAIVISENIAKHRERGEDALEAAINGARNVMPGVMASFATTTFMFGSLIFLKGEMGQIIGVVPIVMLAVLTVSIIEAFLILPNHLGHALVHAKPEKSRMQKISEGLIHFLRSYIFGPVTDICVRFRYFTAGATVMLLLLSISLISGGYVKFSAFPDLDGDNIDARILMPQGTPLHETEVVVAHMLEKLEIINKKFTPLQPDKQKLIVNTTVLYNFNEDASESGAHLATISIDLLGAEIRTVTPDELMEEWRQLTGKLPNVIAINYAEPVRGPAGHAFDLRLVGNNLEELKAASLEMQAWLKRYDGAINISDDMRPGKLEFQISMKEGAKNLGVTAAMVADQLRNAFYGKVVSEIQLGREAYEIDVRLSREDRSSRADLYDFRVTTPDGSLVPLSVIAHVKQGRGYARINRVNGVRAVTVLGEVDKKRANANEILADMRTRFFPDFFKKHKTVRLDVGGQEKEVGKTQSSMLRGFLLGLMGVYLLLSFQFRSYVEPAVIMIVIPFSFIGAVFGHYIMGLEFTMPSMFGFFALSGIVVNDSILLVNFIKEHHSSGMTVAEAAPAAARARFRAIFLTSVTTFTGMFPILTETSMQAQVLIPMVTSLTFGLLASTFLVLFFVPAIYSILDDFGLTTLAKERREKTAEHH